MNIKPFILIPAFASLIACGGSGSSLTDDGTVSLLVTDNLTQDYAEVWVNIHSVSATDNNGLTVVLYEDATGQTYNLSQLANIGALVDTQSITAGSYISFDIVMANDITLVDPNGAVTNATFDQSGNPDYNVSVNGSLQVEANQATTLALDFDLQQFTYDATSNTVNPVVVQKDPSTLHQTITTLYGEVEAITSSNQFVLDPIGEGRNLNVTLHNNATVTNSATGEVLSDTSGLAINTHVSVSGNYDASTLTITASDVQSGSDASSLTHEIEGIIETVNGGMLSINIHEANFMPSTNSISLDVSNAAFSHGALNQLALGQKIEIKGNWDGTAFTPAVVEIEGYSGNRSDDESDDNYMDDYAEIEGEISAVDNNALTITVREREYVSGINVGDSVTIDSGNSWIKHGNSSCLAMGTVIEAKGPMTGNATMSANTIEIESDCGGDGNSNSDLGDDDSNDDSNDESDDDNEDSDDD